jgi:hypothetical protein
MYYQSSSGHDFFKVDEVEKSIIFISSNPLQTRLSVMKDEKFYNNTMNIILSGKMGTSSEEAFNQKYNEIKALF